MTRVEDIEGMFQTLSSTLGDLAEAVRVKNYDWQEAHNVIESLKEKVLKKEEENEFLRGLVSEAADA